MMIRNTCAVQDNQLIVVLFNINLHPLQRDLSEFLEEGN